MTGLRHDRTATSLNLDEIEHICLAFHHLCLEDNQNNLDHIDPHVQSEIDATDRCLSMEQDLEDCDDLLEGDEKPVKFDIKF